MDSMFSAVEVWLWRQASVSAQRRSEMMEITVALAQMELATGRPVLNEAAARELADQAADQGAHLLLLPELWFTGYDLARSDRYATALDAGPFAVMAELARQHHMHVVGSELEINPSGAPFNTATLHGPDGNLVGAYRKVHLFPPTGETEHMTAGDALPTFDQPWGCTALAICYDLRFPELCRHYTAAGACLILIPAAWPVRRVEHWQLLLRTRALENQLFIVGCNRAGSEAGADGGRFGGHSAAVDPWGRVLLEGGLERGLLVVTLDLDEVSRARRLFPWLDDRRPEVYE
jgi:predicted amidohydrolase